MSNSNLPPGCTDAMIEAQVGTDKQLCDYFAEQAEKAARDWDGVDDSELIIGIFEAIGRDDDDILDALAKVRGELEMRLQRRRKAGK